MQLYPSFETKRLYLNPTSEADAAFILELINSPSWLHFVGDRKVYTIEAAREYIAARMRPQLERKGYSNYTLTTKQDGVKVGVCGLFERDGANDTEIGFALLPKFEKQGYAFEAAEKLMQAAFERFHITMLSALTTTEHFASRRLLEKLGFSYISMLQIPNDDALLMLHQRQLP